MHRTQATGPDNLPFNAPATFSVGNKGVGNILGSTMYDADNNPQTDPVPAASGAGGILIGADQNDILYAGYGSDLLIGGGGADSFTFTYRGYSNRGAIDLIDDFQGGIDKIDLRGINIGVTTGDWITYESLTTAASKYDAATNITTLVQAGATSNVPDSNMDFSLKLFGNFTDEHGRITLAENDFFFV